MFVCAHPARRDLPEQGIDFLRGRRNRSTLATESPFSSVDSHLLVLRDFDIGSHFVLLPSFVLQFCDSFGFGLLPSLLFPFGADKGAGASACFYVA